MDKELILFLLVVISVLVGLAICVTIYFRFIKKKPAPDPEPSPPLPEEPFPFYVNLYGVIWNLDGLEAFLKTYREKAGDARRRAGMYTGKGVPMLSFGYNLGSETRFTGFTLKEYLESHKIDISLVK